MFTFLSQFLDEYPTINLIICCLTLVLWMLHLHLEFFESDANQNRLERSMKKRKSRCNSNDSGIVESISWIKAASIECNRFSTNIQTNFAEKFFSSTPLTWYGFANIPTRMLFQNTGHDARMTAIYETGNIPFVSGDAVGAKFLFRTIRFLWYRSAASNSSNIEHTVNGQIFNMEMQMLAENENKYMPNRFLIFSWFFIQNKSKNYSVEPLLKCLKHIRQPNTMKTIRKPFPLDRIVLPSASGFYGYIRCDRTHQIHHQLIEANHLIPIGITQMSEFYKLAHRIECASAVNERVRIENHSSNAIKLVEYLNGATNRRLSIPRTV